MVDINKLPLPVEIYRHYKGGTYEIVTLAAHSETQEKVVVYKSLNFGSYHVRPLSMWFDVIDDTKIEIVYRFRQM